MATGTSQPAKGFDRLGASIFSESIISYDYNQVFVVNTRDDNPTNFVASHKEVGKEYQHIWRMDLAEVGKNLALDDALAFQGLLKILEVSDSHVGYFNLTEQIHVGKRKEVMESFDIVFSNAVLHWIPDHQPVLDDISRGLRSGGKTILQMGGRGNAAGVVAIMDGLIQENSWKSYFKDFTFPYTFYAPGEYRSWLAAAGLEADRVELIPKDMVHDGLQELAGWIRTTWLPYVSRLPVEHREAFIDKVVVRYLDTVPLDEAGRSHVQMIRLDVEARKQRL